MVKDNLKDYIIKTYLKKLSPIKASVTILLTKTTLIKPFFTIIKEINT